MNIELYIQSGIVESYVLGLATAIEVAEFEQLLPHFPELKDALSDFEYELELFAIDHEILPPPGNREKIEARLREMPAVRRPARSRNGYYRRQRSEEYIRVESSSSTHIWVHKNWRAWFIIFCVMSKIFLAISVYYFVEYRHARENIRQLQLQLDKKNGGTSK